MFSAFVQDFLYSFFLSKQLRSILQTIFITVLHSWKALNYQNASPLAYSAQGVVGFALNASFFRVYFLFLRNSIVNSIEKFEAKCRKKNKYPSKKQTKREIQRVKERQRKKDRETEGERERDIQRKKVKYKIANKANY